MSSRLLIAVLSTLLFATACVPQTTPTNLPPPPPPPPMPTSTPPGVGAGIALYAGPHFNHQPADGRLHARR